MARKVLSLFIASVFILWCFLFSGCVGSKKTYNISGRVTSAETGEGLGGVSITFSGGFSPVTTSDNGYWSKTGLSGTVTVTPVKSGYVFTPPYIVVNGATSKVNFTASSSTTTPTPSPTSSPTPTPTSTPTPSPTSTPSPTPTSTPTPSPTSTPTPTPTLTPTPEPPAAPSNLQVTGITNTSITLTWQDNANNETGFYIYRREATGTYPSSPLVTLGADATVYTDSSVVTGKTYYYRVCAYNAGGSSGFSNETQALALNPGVPVAPKNLSLTISGTSVLLSWQDVSDNEQSFVVERKEEGGTYSVIKELFSSDIAGKNKEVTYTDMISDQNKIYYYRVKAKNIYGESSYSNEVKTSGNIEIIIR